MRRTRLLAVTVMLLMVAMDIVVVAQAPPWMEQVGLPLPGYTGKDVLVVIVSNGIDVKHPEIASRLLAVNGIPCAVAFDSYGNMYTPPIPPPTSIGTRQALEIVETAPDVKLAVVEVPYVEGVNGLPTIPPAALKAALEWLLNPYVRVGNNTLLACDFLRFSTVIVLLGLPVYTNYTLAPDVVDLLEKLSAKYLLVTPVGDVGPGILNVLAKKIGVISVTWVPLNGGVILNGHSGGFWLETPQGEYRDIPLAPSYAMPVNPADCAIGYSTSVATCSEVAAARFAGLAAILAEAYTDLRGAAPLPYQLEHFIRASVRDLGQPSKDTLYGWGVPDARIARELLASNSGFRICASSYARSSFALVELSAGEGLRYATVLYPGECVRVEALPSTPYRITVYGPLDLDPGSVVATTVAGYYAKVIVPAAFTAGISITGRVVDEKGVSLRGELFVTPPSLLEVNSIDVHVMLHPLNFTRGNIDVVFSQKLLALLGPEVYLVVRPKGYLARIYRLATDKPYTLDLGVQVFVEAPSVYMMGRGPGSEETANALRMLGFNVTLGASPYPPLGTSVVVVHPSMASSVWQALSSGYGTVVMGEAALVARRAVSWYDSLVEARVPGEVMYSPAYQPVLGGMVRLLALLGYANSYNGPYKLTFYNITLAPSESRLVLLYSLPPAPQGRVVEVAFDPFAGVAYVANLWGYWGTRLETRGASVAVSPRSLLASASMEALAALQLAVAAAAHPIWIRINATQVHVGDTLLVSLWGWRLWVTVWRENANGGFEKLADIQAPYPFYHANLTVRVPLLPHGSYAILANDSLWGLAIIRYTVIPALHAEPSVVYAGSMIKLSGNGYPANATLQVLFDGVAVYSVVSDPYGSFTSIVRVPGVAEPGNHSISVIYDGLGASVVILVRVRRPLSVEVTVPSVVESNTTAYGMIVTLLGGQRVDANVTVYLAGYTIRPSRVARGLYSFSIPPLPPGTYTVLVEASAEESLVEARGEAVASFTVVTIPSNKAIVLSLARLLTSYYLLFNESSAGIIGKLEEVRRYLQDMLGRINALNTSLEGLKSNILRFLEAARSDIRDELRRVSRNIADFNTRLGSLEARVEQLPTSVSKTVASSISSQLRASENRLLASISALNAKFNVLNDTLLNLYSLVRVKGLSPFLAHLLLVLVVIAVALSAATLVLVRRK